jgi:hypothetical protein
LCTALGSSSVAKGDIECGLADQAVRLGLTDDEPLQEIEHHPAPALGRTRERIVIHGRVERLLLERRLAEPDLEQGLTGVGGEAVLAVLLEERLQRRRIPRGERLEAGLILGREARLAHGFQIQPLAVRIEGHDEVGQQVVA